jgi:hypothetical protein
VSRQNCDFPNISSFQDSELVTEGGVLGIKAPQGVFERLMRHHLLLKVRVKTEGKTKNYITKLM